MKLSPLIETFIAGINDVDDVMTEWNGFVAQQEAAEKSTVLK